ncbi:hydroxymethylpyrimidine/phosphomethylpyrimidine kinase [Flavobacterium terrae]|uniref:hydroxymethylpyrimidine kinase n=1 Tax=Flavobacterium terrae TaxID=415425 RepID=A0A1M6AXC5_9FLAO|nr:hydroxymethylpyrimidine/phosphomethylpyrimidine kinase [Flavobacterium terrae]SHI41100.1 hydroxymethylpyrimidine/phosphomethylpyrimidine kinase [Flavobacterium terrae]
MSANRPFVLSIAGFDPTGGAGVLADVKTFEQHQVYGLAIVTGNTIQTEDSFHAMRWVDLDFILNSIEKLFKVYDIKAVKIGIIPSLDYLKRIIEEIRKYSSEVKIVWDTVLKSTTQFEFANIENQSVLIGILNKIDLITPNYNEIVQFGNNQQSAEEVSLQLSKHCAVLLKGGHNLESIGTDYLYNHGMIFKINPYAISVVQKHGSGCVLSSAITANLALNNDLPKSCRNSKLYIENFLNTNNTLLGYHHV